jgi:hypothetical protein
MISRVPVCECLSCGRRIDSCLKVSGSASPVANRTISMCADCGAIAIFGDGLVLRPLTDAEAEKVTASAALMDQLRETSALVHFAKGAARN